jgi:hypothetical protein
MEAEGSSSLAHLVFDMGDHTIFVRWHDNVMGEMAFVTREELNRCEDATQMTGKYSLPILVFLAVFFMCSWLVLFVLMLVYQGFSCHTLILCRGFL